MGVFAIAFVVGVSGLVLIVTLVGTRKKDDSPAQSREQLEQYRNALLEEARRAELEKWDDATIEQIREDIDGIDSRLSRMNQRKT